MPGHIIQFACLEELALEAIVKPIRVMVLDVTESTSSQIPGLRVAGIGVHARSINPEGHILACYLPVASVQIYDAVPRGSDPTRQEYEAAWEEAEALRERVMAYLTTQGCAVSGAGVIYMNGVRPLPATWKTDPERSKAVGANGHRPGERTP